MNPYARDDRKSLVEWKDIMDTLKLSDGQLRLFCPICEFYIDCKGFDGDIDMGNHIESEHPENVWSLYDSLHLDRKNQKTLDEAGRH